MAEELEKIASEVERAVEHSLMLRISRKSLIDKLAEKFGFKPEEVAVFMEPELPANRPKPDIVLMVKGTLFIIEVTSRPGPAAVKRLLAASETLKEMFKAERVVHVLACTRGASLNRKFLKWLERCGIVLLRL